MNDFIVLMEKVLGLLRIRFVIYGHSLSFWDVSIWIVVVSTVLGFIAHILND